MTKILFADAGESIDGLARRCVADKASAFVHNQTLYTAQVSWTEHPRSMDFVLRLKPKDGAMVLIIRSIEVDGL